MTNNIEYIKSLKNILLSKFYYLDIIKNGSFTLKNGTTSNIYIDFRKLINYPQFFSYLEKLIDLMYPSLLQKETNKLMSIPMGGIPLGNYLSFAKCIPQVMIRDKPKNHGTKNIIEGVYYDKDDFIIIEDVITSGSSIKESLQNLFNYCINNLKYKAILCICNRGSLENLEISTIYNITIPIYSIFTLSEIENYLVKFNSLAPINYFINHTNYTNHTNKLSDSFQNELYKIATIKKSNIILSCDFMNDKETLSIIENIGENIIAVKLHLDTIKTFNYEEFFNKLNFLKNKYKLLIIEDAKIADIETIIYEKIYSSRMMINNIADAITIHAIAGLSILENEKIKIPMIIVSEMSSNDNMIDIDYSKKIIKRIRNTEHMYANQSANSSLLGGLVCQNNIPKLINPFEFLTISPGINLDDKNDSGNQKYSIPDVKNNKVGLFWIVGRGITKYKDDFKILQSKMELYKETGWQYFITY